MVWKNLFQKHFSNSKENVVDDMAISNIDANVRSTNNSNMNTKKLKETKF